MQTEYGAVRMDSSSPTLDALCGGFVVFNTLTFSHIRLAHTTSWLADRRSSFTFDPNRVASARFRATTQRLIVHRSHLFLMQDGTAIGETSERPRHLASSFVFTVVETNHASRRYPTAGLILG